MKGCRVNQLTVWIVSGLALVTSSVWAQTVSPIQNGQVEISGALPRTGSGAVDIEALKQTIQAQFARPGVQEVHVRNVALTEAEQRALFLNSDPNKNLLRQVSSVVPLAMLASCLIVTVEPVSAAGAGERPMTVDDALVTT